MKRSEINRIIREAKEFLASHQFRLPPWAIWADSLKTTGRSRGRGGRKKGRPG